MLLVKNTNGFRIFQESHVGNKYTQIHVLFTIYTTISKNTLYNMYFISYIFEKTKFLISLGLQFISFIENEQYLKQRDMFKN